MKRKRACVVINPHAGQNVTQVADLIAVLSAAGWSTEIVIKEYGGHSMELAARAAKANYGLVIGYGGDGTLNQVLNGVMSTRKHSSLIGIIPGGTANVWAAEIGVPKDPVHAALTLCNSEARKIDIGHVEVQGLSFPVTSQSQDNQDQRQKKREKRIPQRGEKATTSAKHYFMLMAGLGIDAAIMEHVSKSLKYHVGSLAVGLSAVEELPKQHPFPIEICVSGTKYEEEKIWKGEAFQVIIGNTRRYANLVELTPNAYLDSGLLEVCVITAGNILTTLEQIASLLFRRKPDNVATEYFHGAGITIKVPASIDLQLDGSPARLNDYLNKSDREALQSAGNAEQVMVTYRFDAMPHAVKVAIPRTYDGALFEKVTAKEKSQATLHEHKGAGAVQQNHRFVEEVQHESREQIATLLANGHQVTVRGVASHSQKQHTYIIAGTVSHRMTGDMTPVALCIDESVIILRHSGELVSPLLIQELQGGAVIFAEGKKNKYGVIRATRVVI
jgi:YegS/Rv2252/BmrU family lipid kinase